MVYTQPQGPVIPMYKLKDGECGITINNYGYTEYDNFLVQRQGNKIIGFNSSNKTYTWYIFSSLKVELL